MDPTIRDVLGFRVRKDGTALTIGLKTVEGVAVEVDLIPEAVMNLILALLQARQEAWVRSEGGVPGDVPSLESPMRGVIPAQKIVSASYPDRGKRLLQIVTQSGTIFEFLLPADAPGIKASD